mgnify:CR=1 FL=1
MGSEMCIRDSVCPVCPVLLSGSSCLPNLSSFYVSCGHLVRPSAYVLEIKNRLGPKNKVAVSFVCYLKSVSLISA